VISFAHLKKNQRRLWWKKLTVKVLRRERRWERQWRLLVKRGRAVWNPTREYYDPR